MSSLDTGNTAPDPDPANATGQVASPTRRNWLNSAVIIIVATIGSRGLGLLRDIVLANQFGTGPTLAAYKAAFRVPDLLYTLIVGGALGSSLIPVFSRFLGRNEGEKAWKLANAVVNYALLGLVVAAGVAWVLMPTLVEVVLAPSYPREVQLLTIDLARLLLIQPFFMGLGGIALSLLNGHENFLWPALAPLIYNISIILGAVFLVGPLGIYGVITGVIVGAVLYLLVQLPALWRLGFYWRPSLQLRRTEGAAPVLKALGPRLIGQAVFQFNFIVATNLGSRLDNGPARVVAFENGYTIFMLPHGIFAMSLATVAFPAMARLLGANDLPGMKRTLAGSLRQVYFFALPAAVGLAVLARPIVSTIYQSGRFDQQSTDLVSATVMYFSFGLISYGLVEILTRAFYAMQDTRTPVIIAVVTVGLNFIFSLALVGWLAQGGLALALALSTTVEMIGLAIMLLRRIGRVPGLVGPGLKITGAAALMGLVIWLGQWWLSAPLAEGNKLVVVALTGLLVGLGGGIYVVTAYLLRIEELQGLVARFRRR